MSSRPHAWVCKLAEDAGYTRVQPAEDVTYTGNCFWVTNYRREKVKSQGWISANRQWQHRQCQACFWFQIPLKWAWLSSCQILKKSSFHLESEAHSALCLKPSDKMDFSCRQKVMSYLKPSNVHRRRQNKGGPIWMDSITLGKTSLMSQRTPNKNFV